MSSLNKATLIGNLGGDPEVVGFSNGGRIANLRIATTERWKDRQTQERKERTEWHSVVIVSDGLVGVAEKYLAKGSKVYIEGQLRTRKWQDRDGNDRYTTEVLVGMQGRLLMLDGASGENRGNGGTGGGSGSSRGAGRGHDHIPHGGYRGPSGGSLGPERPADLDDDLEEVPF